MIISAAYQKTKKPPNKKKNHSSIMSITLIVVFILAACSGAWRSTFSPGALGVYSYKGESRRITVHLPVNQLAFFDNELSLVLEPGAIQVMVVSSSQDIRLSEEFAIVGAGKIHVDERVFVCPVTLA
jgi:hypothetical protein